MAQSTYTTTVPTKSGTIRSHGSTVITAAAASLVSATVVAHETDRLKQSGATVAARVIDGGDVLVDVAGPVGAGPIDVVVVTVDA